MQAIFRSPGKQINYTPGSAVGAGDVVMFGDQPMVAERDIAAGALGALTGAGVFDAVKDTSVIVLGDPIYWHVTGSPVDGDASSGAANNVAAGGYLLGQALEAAATDVERVKVNLLAGVNILRGEYPSATFADLLEGGSPQGTREQSATQNYPLGAKRAYADGRVFRYVKARTALEPEFGAGYAAKTITNAVAPTQATGAGTAGSYTVTITVGATDGLAGDGAIALNELAGGYVVVGNGTSQHPDNRRILSNTAEAGGGGPITLTLDEPLVTAVEVGVTNIEVLMNPWILSDGNATSSAYITFRGMPARSVTINYFAWVQTAGTCWITSDGHTCDSAGDRQVYFAANGSCVSGNDVTGDVNVQQLAGHAIDMSSSGASNAPFVNLCLEVS
jgi:predicted RecA/RadA family phage recombinase